MTAEELLAKAKQQAEEVPQFPGDEKYRLIQMFIRGTKHGSDLVYAGVHANLELQKAKLNNTEN